MSRYNIFISSTIDDLKEARAGVDQELQEMEIFEPVRVEKLPASEETSRRVCLREVADADAVVLILKERYGFVPEGNNPDKLSVTHLEYREARRLKKPVFAFFADGAQPETQLSSFIRELSDFDEGVLRKKWITTRELRDAVRRALLFWIARSARETKSRESQQKAESALSRDAKFGRLLIVSDPASLQDYRLQSWRRILLEQLFRDCKHKLLPTPNLIEDQELRPGDGPVLSLRIRTSSQPGRLDLAVSVADHPQLFLPGPLELDAALTEDGARFAAFCSLALVLLVADDWSGAIDQLLKVSGLRGASSRTRTRVLSATAYVSMSHQGQRSAEIVMRILALPKLDSHVVSAGAMALISAELRLGHAMARHALGETEKLAFQLLTTALTQEPTAAEHIYNLARQSFKLDGLIAIAFYRELLHTDPSYEERWYFHRDLGLIHFNHGDHRSAAKHYDHACYLKDNDSELFRMAGDAYYYRGRWAAALLRYERALSIEPVESYFLDAKVDFCRARLPNESYRDTAFRRERDVSHRFSGAGVRAAEAGQRWLAQPLFHSREDSAS